MVEFVDIAVLVFLGVTGFSIMRQKNLFAAVMMAGIYSLLSAGLFGVNTLFPLVFQIVLIKGNFVFSFPPAAHPVSIKYSFAEFFGFKNKTLSFPFKVSL